MFYFKFSIVPGWGLSHIARSSFSGGINIVAKHYYMGQIYNHYRYHLHIIEIFIFTSDFIMVIECFITIPFSYLSLYERHPSH